MCNMMIIYVDSVWNTGIVLEVQSGYFQQIRSISTCSQSLRLRAQCSRESHTRALSKIAPRKLLSRPVRKLKDEWIGLLLIKNSPV